MFHHEFVVNNHAIWVKGEISKLEAFASICPIPADQFMVSAFAMNFPTATPLQAKDLDQLQRPPSGTFTVVRRSPGPLPTTQATSVTQAPECQAAALRLRHEHVVPAAVLRTLDHLQPGVGWSMVALRQQEDLHLPAVDYSLDNRKLLPQLCHLLLQKCGSLAAQGRQKPPPTHATLTLGLYADGYQPRGRPNINTKISIIDFQGHWFPMSGNVPRCTDMLTWQELPKVSDCQWLPIPAEALQALHSCKFKQRMKYAGAVYNTTLQIRLGANTADHHHLWSECRQKGCVACPSVNEDGAGELFLHKGGCLNAMRGSHKFQGVSNLEEVYIVHPVLHNTKGTASRILGVIGRTLAAPYNHDLLQVIAHVARRYDPGSLPPDSRQHMRHVRGRFQAGISLTGREARTVMGRLAGGMVLPLPFHSLVVAFCHMVHLCYGCNNLATVTWQAMGMLYTYIVHIIPEFAEQGCTATLYMHGWSHTWFNPRTPTLYSDEAGERDLRVAKRYAPVTSTKQDASISESLKHELYQKFVQNKKKIPCAKIWAPVQRNVVLEACMVAANAVWHVVFQRLLEHLLHFQDGGGCSLYMHPDTRSVKCAFLGANPESDEVCVCGTCGSKRGVRQWVPLDREAVCKWPKLGLKSRATFKSCAARRKALKDKGKGKGRVGPIPQSRVSNPAAVDVVPPSEGEDSAASFQGPTGLNEQQRVQPMRRTKLARVPIVDSDIEQQLVCPHGSRGNSSNSSSSSSSSSSNDSGSSSSPEDNDSDDDAVHLSGASTVSASDYSSSSSDNPEPQPQAKKYRRVVVDVDAMSSDGCPVQMLSEGEYSIHSSS